MGSPFHLNRILIIRMSSMGDVLLTAPLIRMVKTCYPNLQIDFLVKKMYEPLLRCNSHIDRLIVFSPEEGLSQIRRQIREEKYDYIVDLQKNLRSLMVRFFARTRKTVPYHLGRWKRFLLVHFRMYMDVDFKPVPLRYLDSLSQWGIADDGMGLELKIEEDAERSIDRHLAERGIREIDRGVVLIPGSSYWTKRWPAQKFAQVGTYFCKKGRPVFILGGDEDKLVCQKVEAAIKMGVYNFAGQLTLQETAALLNKISLLITNDTGVMHMGAALKKRIVAIFGPTTHHLGFMPFRASALVVERPLHCRPCSYHGTETCPKGHFQCMEQIHSSDVIHASEMLLEGN